MSDYKIKVAVCGGSGYTGGELIRLLSSHPHLDLTAVTSERSAGKAVTDLFPHLGGLTDLSFEPLDNEKLVDRAYLFFMALPHAASQEAVNFLYTAGKHVIDLSADFRLKDHLIYQKWYGTEHGYPRALKRAVYGLPELYRRRLKRARLIANPGCYPTGAILGSYPALKRGIVDADSAVIDSKSGTSGAGRKADPLYTFCEINESFRAYGIATHRHTPEIEQEFSVITGKNTAVNFTPHLLPITRGLLTTIYYPMREELTTEEITGIYKKTYRREPFIRVCDPGQFPDVRNVRGTNFCDIGLKVNSRTGTLVIITAIDNLLKGASGQALQNMNIMMGLEETAGLTHFSPLP